MIKEQLCPECGSDELTLADSGVGTFICKSCSYIGPLDESKEVREMDDELGGSHRMNEMEEVEDELGELDEGGSVNLLKAARASASMKKSKVSKSVKSVKVSKTKARGKKR